MVTRSRSIIYGSNVLSVEGSTQIANERPPEAVDGTRVAFSTVYRFRVNSLKLYVAGVRQEEIFKYTINEDRRGYVFVRPPRNGALILQDYTIDQ